ncbi:hypothetical protein OH76DRAFT_184781 [Lentinus brumalis]|uniref:Uncharacterized protein n=1 Tax=Lentinus brumalis TaxID=2498619 RepID=A0A371CN21_9APHY|nr:hypothetical protein OH76DRAFT_184781 [Polyporus brumalis]
MWRPRRKQAALQRLRHADCLAAAVGDFIWERHWDTASLDRNGSEHRRSSSRRESIASRPAYSVAAAVTVISTLQRVGCQSFCLSDFAQTKCANALACPWAGRQTLAIAPECAPRSRRLRGRLRSTSAVKSSPEAGPDPLAVLSSSSVATVVGLRTPSSCTAVMKNPPGLRETPAGMSR